ncbi:TIGR01777 family oxidoreductase [Lentisphaera marina]|uniref:TIGR01777 family oxidoreductase n=1 Tax=Lentisphaera marina TaxID=1111041 RepID=UPI0023668748|nr:TIGR01777 family oxidoreductase [Lentisphaera marina]MDD7985978.1 TIGR01777 family oxidoreductase [Lentisphaera marina]
MKILVAGSSGFIGQALLVELSKQEHQVSRLVRRPTQSQEEIQWDPTSGKLDPKQIEGFDAIIHLGGAGVADKIWTKKYKDLILKSRTESTKTLCQAIALCQTKPKVFICSSGVNYYGSQSQETLTEKSPIGKSFLAHVCEQWEKASEKLDHLSVRRVLLRTGVVLDPSGGMLAKTMPVFKMGLGGNIGMGQRHFPWISLADSIKVITHCLEDNSLQGAVNMTAPEIITNQKFTRTLAKHLKRPSVFPVPTLIFKLLPKEMADDLFLCDLKVQPKKLINSSFVFTHPNINSLLKAPS